MNYLRTLQASNVEKSTVDVKKQTRGTVDGALPPTTAAQACSLDAMLNGGECEACQ